MWVESTLTGERYNSKDVCRIINMRQLAAYLEYGVKLQDVYASRDRESNEPIQVGIVNRADSYAAYQLWCNHEQK